MLLLPVRALRLYSSRSDSLQNYFSMTKFGFLKESHRDFLRAQMELVYLRQKPLVAIDVEAYERNPSKLTEIGVSIYDPTEQDNLILPLIKNLHIIVKEHKNLLNKRFVPNRKFHFNGGVSYALTLEELKTHLSKLFAYYFSQRGAILVGHNLGGDIRWLTGYGIEKAETIPKVDTQTLFRISKKKGATLRGVLRTVGIPHSNLHNAANDSYYTLLAAFSYTDPHQRAAFGLDTYEDAEPVPETERAKEKQRKYFEKFDDRCIVKQGELLQIENFIGGIEEQKLRVSAQDTGDESTNTSHVQ